MVLATTSAVYTSNVRKRLRWSLAGHSGCESTEREPGPLELRSMPATMMLGDSNVTIRWAGTHS